VGPVMVKVETTSGVGAGAGVVVVMVGVGVGVELTLALCVVDCRVEVLELVLEGRGEDSFVGVLADDELVDLVVRDDVGEADAEDEDEVVEVLVLLEEKVVLTDVVVLDGADSAVWVGLLANSPWDLSDKVIEGTAVEADVEDEVETVEVLALFEVVVVLTVVALDGVCVDLTSSPWEWSDRSIEGRGMAAVGLLVWEVTVLTGEALRDSGLASWVGLLVIEVLVLLEEKVVLTDVVVLDGADSAVWVGLLVTILVEVVMMETLTRLPSLAVVTTKGVIVIPGPERDVVLTAIGVDSSRVFSVVSTPLESTILVDVTDGWGETVWPEGSTTRKVVLLIVGPGGVTTTTFVVGVWVLEVLVFIPKFPKRSAIREASMMAELLDVEVKVVDEEGEAVGDGVELVGNEVLAALAVIVVLKVVVSTTGAWGAM
jgi:hypothetical protein